MGHTHRYQIDFKKKKNQVKSPSIWSRVPELGSDPPIRSDRDTGRDTFELPKSNLYSLSYGPFTRNGLSAKSVRLGQFGWVCPARSVRLGLSDLISSIRSVQLGQSNWVSLVRSVRLGLSRWVSPTRSVRLGQSD